MDIAKIEEKLDKTAVGGVAVSDHIGGIAFTNMAEVMEFAKLMSLADKAIPRHLRGNPGACLAITIQAQEWRMSPFSVANKSYEVNDRIAYESQLLHAIIEARANLKQRLRCTYAGEGPTRTCTIIGHFKNEADPLEYTSPEIGKIKVKNSPLWQSDPDQQLFYYSSRAWARRWAPDVLLGIYGKDELEDSEIGPEHAKDITPDKPDIGQRLRANKRKDTGFQAAQIEGQINGKTAPPDAPTGQTAATDAPTGEKDQPAQATEPPPAQEPENAAQEPKTAAKKEPKPAKEETVMERGQRLLGKLKTVEDINDLHDSIAEELPEAERSAWTEAVDKHRSGLLP